MHGWQASPKASPRAARERGVRVARASRAPLAGARSIRECHRRGGASRWRRALAGRGVAPDLRVDAADILSFQKRFTMYRADPTFPEPLSKAAPWRPQHLSGSAAIDGWQCGTSHRSRQSRSASRPRRRLPSAPRFCPPRIADLVVTAGMRAACCQSPPARRCAQPIAGSQPHRRAACASSMRLQTHSIVSDSRHAMFLS